MNTLSNNPYVATVAAENERSFFLSDLEGKKVDITLRKLGFIPSEESITDIRLDDINNSLKKIGIKPRIRISHIGRNTEIQFTLKIRSIESGSTFQSVFDTIDQQTSDTILSEKKDKLVKFYTKNGKYEEGREITIKFPLDVVDGMGEEAMTKSIYRYLQKNSENITQEFQRAFKESNISSSEIEFNSDILASLQVIDVRSRKRMNYHQSIDGIYPKIVVALEPGRSQMKLDIEGPNDAVIRSFATKLGVIPHLSDSVVEELTKNIGSNVTTILQELSPYAKSQMIRRIVWSHIINLDSEGYDGITGKFVLKEPGRSIEKKDNFRKFDRWYPLYQNEIQKYFIQKSHEPHISVHEAKNQIQKKLFAIFVIFGEKINPTLFPKLLHLPEKTLQKYKMKILSWHVKHGDSPFFKMLRNGMRQAMRQNISTNHSVISDETIHSVYRDHMIAMLGELYRLFEIYYDSKGGIPGDIFEKMKNYITLFKKLLAEGINLGEKDTDQFFDFVSQQSQHLAGVDYLIEHFREAMLHAYSGDAFDKIKHAIDQKLRVRRDVDQEQWKGNDIITRHSELFDKIDILNITFDEWMRMTHRARISFFIHHIISFDTEKHTLKLNDRFVEKIKKTRLGLFKAIAQPLYKEFYSTIYDNEDYVLSLQRQYDQINSKLANTKDITDFVRNNMNDVYLLLAMFEQTFKDKKDQEAQKKYSNISYGVMQTLGDRMQRGGVFTKIDESKKGLYFAMRPKNRAGITLENSLERYEHQIEHYNINLLDDDFQFSFLGERYYMKDISQLYILSSSAPENRAFLKYVAIDIVARLLGGEHIDMIHPYADEEQYPDLQILKGHDGEFGKMYKKYEDFKKTLFQYGFVAENGDIRKNELFHLRRFLKFAYSQVEIVDKMLAQSTSEDRAALLDILDTKKVTNKELKQMLHQSQIDIPFDTKDFERTFIKNISKYAGGHEGLGDLVRARIILDTTDRSIDMVSHLIEHLCQHNAIHAFIIQDNTGNLMEKPKKSTGYRDITFSIQLNSGNIIEIQLVARPMFEVKTIGYHMHHIIGNDSLMKQFRSSIRTDFSPHDRNDIQHIIRSINVYKKNDDILVLPREFNELFGEGVSLDSQYIAERDGMKLSSDMLYKIHRTLPDNSELAQKLKKIESILYDLAMGELVADEIHDMIQKDKKRSKGESAKKGAWFSSSISQIFAQLPIKGR